MARQRVGATKAPIKVQLDGPGPEHRPASWLERFLADAELVGGPFVDMPIAELEAAVAAIVAMHSDAAPRDVPGRRAQALALLPYIRAIIEASPHENEVLLGIEAVEKAWAHFRPRVRMTDPGSDRIYAFAERLISQLDWSLSLILSDSDNPPTAAELGGALAEMNSSIPADRCQDAVKAWLGERPSRRGRPGAVPYHWHRVLYRLLTGSDDVLAAQNFRDNLRKWRTSRRAESRR